MAEETWHAARLIPTSGIHGAEEQERRATSALLAVMTAVREFGRAILTPLGAPAGRLESYIEVPFKLDDREVRPDGLIRVSRGQRTWTALVEVKTGSNELDAPQLEDYLDVAREHDFDALLTVSNQIAPFPGTHPTSIDKRRLKKVALHHLSWTQILTEAVVQKVHRGVGDPDQAWILGELIRYLEHPRSGAMEFDDMGPHWVTVRTAISTGTLRPNDEGAVHVAGRWDQLLRYACLRLGRELGIEVRPALSRKELADPPSRAQALASSLATAGLLDGGILIPNTAGALRLAADLRASRVSCSVELDAPREGRAQTRVKWLVRQLDRGPTDLKLEAAALHQRGPAASALLEAVREDSTVLIDDAKQELRRFKLTLTRPMGSKRGQGRGSFSDSVLDLLDEFYGSVMQNLKAWSARPPKLRQPEDDTLEAAAVQDHLVSTSLSSQDGPIVEEDSKAAGASGQGRGDAASAREETAAPGGAR